VECGPDAPFFGLSAKYFLRIKVILKLEMLWLSFLSRTELWRPTTGLSQILSDLVTDVGSCLLLIRKVSWYLVVVPPAPRTWLLLIRALKVKKNQVIERLWLLMLQVWRARTKLYLNK
jgi:hypothetical protein